MLQSDGSGNLSFIDAPSGGLKFLNRQTVSSSTAFVAFDNTYINTTYDDYIIKGSRIVPVSDGVNMRWFTSSQNGGNMIQVGIQMVWFKEWTIVLFLIQDIMVM